VAPGAAVPGTPDPQMAAVLEELAKLKGKPIETLDAKDARKQPSPADAAAKVAAKLKLPKKVEGVEDSNKKLKVALPIILYVHGGGWAIADLDTYDATPRSLSKLANALVVSTHYRQAPENKFPSAHDDTFGVYRWILENAASIGGDATRVAVVGESAGGNMAANISLRAAKEHIALPAHQALIYPVASFDDTPSMTTYADARPLNKPMLGWFKTQLINTEADVNDPRLNLFKNDLKGQPATTIILAQIDPLHDGGVKLAEAYSKAGVDTKLESYDGVTHEFFGMANVVTKAKQAQDLVVERITASFAKKKAAGT
jgi:acetyl esterase/lipase